MRPLSFHGNPQCTNRIRELQIQIGIAMPRDVGLFYCMVCIPSRQYSGTLNKIPSYC